METVLEYLSKGIVNAIQNYISEYNEEIEEIRLRTNKPIVLKTSNSKKILSYIATIEDILQTYEKVCENSIYSYKREICEGFITIKNGHRVGITGNCAFENGQVININYISSLNFRIAREKKNCSQKLIKHVMNNKEIYNTLIVSKPGCGKTTILRDLIRKISDSGKTCGIVDERGEIASLFKGVSQNDIGILTDVIDNVSKEIGMKMLIRSMSPEVIACDEIGSKEDIDAINYAICSGVKGIFTLHGESLEEILLNNQIVELLKKCIIERIVFLSPTIKGELEDVYYLDRLNKKYCKIYNNTDA